MVSARENLRFERTRGFGTVREIFLAMGAQLQKSGHIHEVRDVFYLTQNEIFDFIKGASVNRTLHELVAYRKKEYLRFEQSGPLSERIRTHGTVYENSFAVQPSTEQSTNSETIKGIGCCAGIVTARVRVVHDPNEVEQMDGDILVTMSTDPGWVTLFPTTSGILVEKGSLLSHSAIVSREMGKPCIVGISGLLKTMKTGMMVRMDGSTGLVEIIQTEDHG